MKRLLLLSLMAVAATGPLHARLGETKIECARRYGTPIKVDPDGSATFVKSGFIIIARFHTGQCDRITFAHSAQNILGKPETITDNEIDVILRSNASGHAWAVATGVSATCKLWRRDDGQAQAQYEIFENFLLIYTSAALDRQTAAKKESENSALNDF